MNHPLYYQIALTMVPGIGCVLARKLLEYYTPEELFTSPKISLNKIENFGEIRTDKIRKGFQYFDRFGMVEREIEFMDKYKIQPLFITDTTYPKRLLNCYDAPVLLYYRGNANLNHSRIVAIVGSRTNTDYGKTITEEFINALSQQDILVVSDLAYGIDSIAHKASLKNQLQTVGVLAHGLDKMYPASHTDMAKEMVKQGGLLTEFMTHTKPDSHNFPSRNRIVAGMSDATIVVETEVKGGSMITAELANGYNKDVFAFPGKITDKKSGGCNYLIKNNKAILLTDAHQLLETLGWQENKKLTKKKTKELFITLTAEEKIIVELLNLHSQLSIDELNFKSALSSSAVAGAMLSLEMQHVIQALPGKIYRLN